MKLILGLGNPEKKYETTKHNVGFMFVESCVNNEDLIETKFKDFLIYKKGELYFAKSLNGMNSSGKNLNKLLKHLNLNYDDLILVFDDLDLNLGQIRFREKGSDGGHNGLKSIFKELGTNEIKRYKIGIGRPSKEISILDYVLSNFEEKEKTEIIFSIKKVKNNLCDLI